MTIEIGAGTPPSAADRTAALRGVLVDAIRNGRSGAPLLRALLSDVTLSPEQQTLVDLLLTSAEPAPADGESRAEVVEETEDIVELRRELADLREANDTVAAALGACPYCWGGDRSCAVCHGRGRPGYAPPDRDLFAELIVPAVNRARAQQRAGLRHGSSRARA